MSTFSFYHDNTNVNWTDVLVRINPSFRFCCIRYGHVALSPWKCLDTGKDKSDVKGWNGVFLVMLCKTFNNTTIYDTLEGRLYHSQEEKVAKDSVWTYLGYFLLLLAQSYESDEFRQELGSLGEA